MRSVGIQHLEAIHGPKQDERSLKRTVHAMFVPDEEISGHDGMQKWVHTEHFKSLNVGFGLVEGPASPDGEIPAYVRVGAQHNVIPEKFVTNVEIRIIPTNDIAQYEAGLCSWMIEAVEWEMVPKGKQGVNTRD